MTTNLQKGMSMSQDQKVNMVIFIKGAKPYLVLDPDTTKAELLESVFFLRLALNVLGRHEEIYIFFYTDENQAEVHKTFGRFAGNPGLSFTWPDDGMLAREVINMAEKPRNALRRRKGETK